MYYVDPSGHICENRANEIMNKLGQNRATRNEQKKLAAYLRNKERHGGLTDAERSALNKVDGYTYLSRYGDLSSYQKNRKTNKGDGNPQTQTTRVGRWMSQKEYDKMVASGKVQMSGDNKVHVANPADINAFGKQAPNGSLYVEFDVPSNTISKGGTDGWGIINGPGSLLDRLNAKKGLPRITEMPSATNITIEGSK